MPSIYQLKPAFQRLLRPLCSGLARSGVTANQVTVGAAAMSAATGLALTLFPGHPRMLLALPVVLFVRMALNAIDGMLAREFGQKSRLGAILNELGDVVSDSALYLPLALWPDFGAVTMVVIVILAILTEMTGVLAVTIEAPRGYQGPMGKSDRAFLFGALGFALGMGLSPGPWIQGLLWLAVGLLAKTVYNRASYALG